MQERANRVIKQIAEAEKFDLILQDGGLRQPAHRHHREGDQGARRQVAARARAARAASTCQWTAPFPARHHAGRARRARPARGSTATAAIVVRRVATLEHAGADAIAFLANPRYRGQLARDAAPAR